jgi:hypothetical protein
MRAVVRGRCSWIFSRRRVFKRVMANSMKEMVEGWCVKGSGLDHHTGIIYEWNNIL